MDRSANDAGAVMAKAMQSPARLAVRRFFRRPAAVFGLFVITSFVLLALLAPFVAPFSPTQTSWTLIRKAPSWAHWMGTDENGRDVLSRVIWGARASLLAGVISVCIASGVGVPVGLLAGFVGGKVDAIIGRIIDAMLAAPFLILAIALAAFLGPSLQNAMIAIGITATPIFVRVSRAATMDAATNDYVEAARAGQPALAGGVPPCAAQYRAADYGAGDAGDCRGDYCGGEPVIPRAWPAATGAVLGQHAQLGATVFDPGAMAGDFPRGGDFPGGVQLHPDRRWAARCAGPARQIGWPRS